MAPNGTKLPFCPVNSNLHIPQTRKQLLYLKETDPRLRLMMQFYQKLHLTLMSLMNPKLLPPRIPQLRQTP